MRNFIITIDGKQYEVGVEEVGGTATPVAVASVAAPAAPVAAAPAAPKATPANGEKVLSPFPGLIEGQFAQRLSEFALANLPDPLRDVLVFDKSPRFRDDR